MNRLLVAAAFGLACWISGIRTAHALQFESCVQPRVHHALQASLEHHPNSSLKSQLFYRLQHEQNDHLQDVTQLRLVVSDNDLTKIERVFAICGPSQRKRKECSDMLRTRGALEGVIDVDIPLHTHEQNIKLFVEQSIEPKVVFSLCPVAPREL